VSFGLAPDKISRAQGIINAKRMELLYEKYSGSKFHKKKRKRTVQLLHVDELI